jgi:thiamine biosynthesis protein ThiS
MDKAQATAAITVNGDVLPLPAGQTVTGLLAALGLDGRKVAVERNEAIVPRSAYDSTVLGAGDNLEIVHFIGGG